MKSPGKMYQTHPNGHASYFEVNVKFWEKEVTLGVLDEPRNDESYPKSSDFDLECNVNINSHP